MAFLPLIVVGALAVGLAIAAILLALQNSKLKGQVEEAQGVARDTQRQIDAARTQMSETSRMLAVATGDRQRLQSELEAEQYRAQARIDEIQTALATEQRDKEEFLDQQEKDIEWLRAELEKRPKVTRKTYKILTLGVSGTGKTALTLKWANPLMDLGALQGTKIERYERTVSHVAGKDLTIEHVFEIGDWGGEHIVDAQQELIVDEIHGLLMVVDLAARDGKAVDPARVQTQLREFQPESLKFFFGPKTLASCKTIVLFINKSDVLAGTPADVERDARRYYQRLIDDLEKYKSHLDVRVLVGSATYGHSTHHLFAHFVERILPKNSYDNQLLQRMKGDAPQDTSTQPIGAGRRPALPPHGGAPPTPPAGQYGATSVPQLSGQRPLAPVPQGSGQYAPAPLQQTPGQYPPAPSPQTPAQYSPAPPPPPAMHPAPPAPGPRPPHGR